MAKCDQCGAHENLPYNCRHCGGTYCAEHRLPENHDCPGLGDWNDPGGVFDSGFDDSVKHPGGRSGEGSLAGRFHLDAGVGGPLGYFRNNMSYVFLAVMWVTFLAEFVVLVALGRGAFQSLFVLSSTHITYVWTWLTSVFAHSPAGFFHIAGNSIVLYFFGPVLERRIGSKKFTALFLISGMAAGLAQAGTGLLLGDPTGVLGASGAIMAIMGVLTVLRPNLRVYLYFILPVPLWVITIGYAGLSVMGVLSPGSVLGGNVAHLAHLTGLGIGLAYGGRLKRRGERVPQQLRIGGARRRGPGGPGRF